MKQNLVPKVLINIKVIKPFSEMFIWQYYGIEHAKASTMVFMPLQNSNSHIFC